MGEALPICPQPYQRRKYYYSMKEKERAAKVSNRRIDSGDPAERAHFIFLDRRYTPCHKRQKSKKTGGPITAAASRVSSNCQWIFRLVPKKSHSI